MLARHRIAPSHFLAISNTDLTRLVFPGVASRSDVAGETRSTTKRPTVPGVCWRSGYGFGLYIYRESLGRLEMVLSGFSGLRTDFLAKRWQSWRILAAIYQEGYHRSVALSSSIRLLRTQARMTCSNRFVAPYDYSLPLRRCATLRKMCAFQELSFINGGSPKPRAWKL